MHQATESYGFCGAGAQAKNQSAALSPNQSVAYEAVQKAIGPPTTERTQVESAIDNLREAIDFQEELIGVLLRRLHPVTGDPAPQPIIGGSVDEAPVAMVLLAHRIETLYSRVRRHNRDVTWAIQALEI